MDQFKEMAEVKMREAIEGQIQGEIDTDQAKLVEAEQDLARLGSEDAQSRQAPVLAPGDLGDAVHQPPGTQSDPTTLEPVPTPCRKEVDVRCAGCSGTVGPMRHRDSVWRVHGSPSGCPAVTLGDRG